MLVSAKRKKTEKIGLHKWLPYYAGYSESFVESALSYFAPFPDEVVLDPWCGSGTTNIVCSRKNIYSIGIDINPAIAFIAAAKSPKVLSEEVKIKSLILSIPDLLKKNIEVSSNNDYLSEIFSDKSALILRKIASIIESTFEGEFNSKKIKLSESLSFCMSVLMVTIKNLADFSLGSNPTWVKISTSKLHVDEHLVVSKMLEIFNVMIGDLHNYYSDEIVKKNFDIFNNDVKKIPLLDSSVNYVITSPPYLTRIDYAVTTRLELSVLGNLEFYKKIRSKTMGATVVNNNVKCPNEEWGGKCLYVLDQIRKHPTKAASTYYYKNIMQYFHDAFESLREIRRVMATGGRGLIVVQSSYFKNIEIPLGEIYTEMAINLGLLATIPFSENVRSHLGHLNSRSNIYASNKSYREEFVEIKKA